jgi:hypothetical protein
MKSFYTHAVRGSGRVLILLLLMLQLAVPPIRAAEPPVEKAPQTQITVLNVALFYAGIIGAVIGACTGWVTWLIMPRLGSSQSVPSRQPPVAVPKP